MAGLTAIKPDGTASFEIAVTADNELIVSGGGGGGGGDATAANQALQLAQGADILVAVEATALNGATSALQTAGNASLSSIDGKLPSVGQANMTASQPVVIAADQTPVATLASSPTHYLQYTSVPSAIDLTTAVAGKKPSRIETYNEVDGVLVTRSAAAPATDVSLYSGFGWTWVMSPNSIQPGTTALPLIVYFV